MLVKLFDTIIQFVDYLKRRYVRLRIRAMHKMNSMRAWDENPNKQIYATPSFSDVLLNNWGKKDVWNEIQLIIAPCGGKVLDIACGTGKVISQLKSFEQCCFYGCDVNALLIEKAIQNGVPEGQLRVCNAAKLPYPDLYFDYAYSIGSFHCMESETIIAEALRESRRVTKNAFFFQVATSRSHINEGLIRSYQHFFNNSVGWWKNECEEVYSKVFVIDSGWNDAMSCGKWFLCFQ